MTNKQKIRAYRSGNWVCLVPPVCTVHWTEDAWIDWIDSNGSWTKKKHSEQDKKGSGK